MKDEDTFSSDGPPFVLHTGSAAIEACGRCVGYAS